MVLFYMGTFGLAIIALWTAIGFGLLSGLPTVPVGVTAALGNITGVLIVLGLGEPARDWITERFFKRHVDPDSRLRRILDRYGVVGLALLAPLTGGAPAGTAVGLVLGIPAPRLLMWMPIGSVVWAIIVTTAGALGFLALEPALPEWLP